MTYDDLGFVRGRLTVRVFHDTREDLPWFYRDSEVVGEVETWLDGSQPADPDDVLRVAREAFGPSACVMW